MTTKNTQTGQFAAKAATPALETEAVETGTTASPEVHQERQGAGMRATPEDSVTLTVQELLALLAKMNDTSSEKLAAAIIESRKPYVDPNKEVNDQMWREQAREQAKREKANTAAYQKSCPHIAGCNSLSDLRDQAGRTSIVWHKLDSTEAIGICTNCTRVFHEDDTDYQEWRTKPSINKMSASGDRFFSDPLAARRVARGETAAR